MEPELFAMESPSPIGRLTVVCDGGGILGLWLEGQKYFGQPLGGLSAIPRRETPLLLAARQWLDAYFAGDAPDVDALPLRPQGSPFRQAVWALLRQIPYGETVTYGALAARLAQDRGLPVSAQAVGGAVGHNPISILIPCHRVVGADGDLTGYAGGIEKKRWLLRHEGAI